jgi:hypothetical protein
MGQRPAKDEMAIVTLGFGEIIRVLLQRSHDIKDNLRNQESSMLDGVMLRMIEEATHAGYPMDAAAVLLIELEGLKESVEEQVEQIRDACGCCRAREVRVARDAEERELLWKGRKNAFGAVGRASPAYYVQDGVVPRTQIAPTLHFIAEVSKRYGLAISNIFHAGDGNLHPLILFDPHQPGQLEKVKQASDEILEYCIAVGGSITGGNDQFPAWSPDGARLAFSRGAPGSRDIYVVNADGSGETDLTPGPDDETDPSWSADGTQIAFVGFPSGGGSRDIFSVTSDGLTRVQLTTTPRSDFAPDWQPVPICTISGTLRKISTYRLPRRTAHFAGVVRMVPTTAPMARAMTQAASAVASVQPRPTIRYWR